MAIGGLTWAFFSMIFQYRRRMHAVHYVNIALSALAIQYHWQWGFTFMSWHLEPYYCWLFFTLSVMSHFISIISLVFIKRKKDVTEN